MADATRGGNRKGGRPRSSEPKTAVSTWIGASLHDRLIEAAKKEEESVSQAMARILRERLSR